MEILESKRLTSTSTSKTDLLTINVILPLSKFILFKLLYLSVYLNFLAVYL